MKNSVPTTLNIDAWDNKTISRLECELQKVNTSSTIANFNLQFHIVAMLQFDDG